MAFNPTNPVSVGLATKVDHYDRVFDNTLLLKTSIEDDGSLIAGLLLRTPEVRGWNETTSAPSISAGALTVDYEAGNVARVSLNANITSLTVSNIPASPKHANFAIRFTADGTPRTVSFGAAFRFPAGVAYTPTSTSGKVDWLSFESVDGGTTWDVLVMGQNL